MRVKDGTGSAGRQSDRQYDVIPRSSGRRVESQLRPGQHLSGARPLLAQPGYLLPVPCGDGTHDQRGQRAQRVEMLTFFGFDLSVHGFLGEDAMGLSAMGIVQWGEEL